MTNHAYPAITAIQATITRAARIEAARATLTDAEAEKPKRKYTRKQTDQPVEQPNEVPSFLTSASDECEGPRNGDSRGTDQ
jgi:hypothetical protein